jgi:hypothetical protein
MDIGIAFRAILGCLFEKRLSSPACLLIHCVGWVGFQFGLNNHIEIIRWLWLRADKK